MAASEPTCFDLLPDELVVKILTTVNRRNSKQETTRETARSFVRVQNVCKRFAQLSRSVRTLEWPLGSFEQAAGLTKFLQHEEVKLTELTLVMASGDVRALPSHLIFTTGLLEQLPTNLIFHFVGSGLAGEPEPDITMLIAYVLISPVLQHLRVSSEGHHIPLAVNSMQNSPPSRMRSLIFDNVSIQPEALEHLLTRLSELETLKVLISGNQNRWPPSNSPEIVSVRSKTLKHLTLHSRVTLVATIKVPCLLTLKSEADRLVLATPKLQKLSIDVRSEMEQAPLKLLEPFSLEHLRLIEIEPSVDWKQKVVPILRHCLDLQSLELEGTVCTIGPSGVSLGCLLASLPPRLASLKIDSDCFDVLEVIANLDEGLVHTGVKALGITCAVTSWKGGEEDAKRELLRAFPNLETLKFSVVR